MARFDLAIRSGGVGRQHGNAPRTASDSRPHRRRTARPGAVFVGRRATGELYSGELARKYPDRDWILSRILWLCGEEPGFNRHGQVDSMRRYIYIHGTPDTEPMGVPRSHGCVRMRNAHVIPLFNHVSPGCRVDIRP